MSLIAAQVAPTLPDLKAAPVADNTIIYDQAPFKWVLGNFTGQGDDTNIIQSNNAAISTGAWVRQPASSIQTGDGEIVEGNLARIRFDSVTAFRTAAIESQGEGSIWRAGRHAYVEAASGATNQHLTNAGGVKFYVVPSSGGYDAEAFGADMTGTIDSSAIMQAVANLLPSNEGTILIPPGTLLLGSQITLPPRVSIRGCGSRGSKIRCVGSGFISVDGATDHGFTCFEGFEMEGAGRTTGTALAIAMGNNLARIQGVRIRDVLIHGFQIGIQARSMWHASIEGCRILNVTYGVRYEGQCVGTSIRSSQIVSELSSYNDGSIGVYADEYSYGDGIARRPEAVLIDGETLIYGFDTNVWINRALSASVINSDLDAALRYGIRCTTIDYGCVISNNYIAIIQNVAEATAVKIDALNAANAAMVSITTNRISSIGDVSIETPGTSTGIQIDGSNRTGEIIVQGNNVGLGAGLSQALYLNTAQAVDVTKNSLSGSYSINAENGGKHNYERNTLNGAIRRIGTRSLDRFWGNRGTAATGYHGIVTMPAGQTSLTLDAQTDLGLPADPVTAAPAFLGMLCHAYQYTGGLSRGNVRASYDGAGNVVVSVATAFGLASGDIWLDLSAL